MNDRFVPFEANGNQGAVPFNLQNLIICLDADFWAVNKYEILDDVRLNNGAHLGDRVFWFNRDCDRTWFLLKWN